MMHARARVRICGASACNAGQTQTSTTDGRTHAMGCDYRDPALYVQLWRWRPGVVVCGRLGARASGTKNVNQLVVSRPRHSVEKDCIPRDSFFCTYRKRIARMCTISLPQHVYVSVRVVGGTTFADPRPQRRLSRPPTANDTDCGGDVKVLSRAPTYTIASTSRDRIIIIITRLAKSHWQCARRSRLVPDSPGVHCISRDLKLEVVQVLSKKKIIDF